MFTKILVPLDRSPLAEQALGQAAAIARASHASMDVVLVHQPMPFGGYEDLPWRADEPAYSDRYLEKIVDELQSGAGISATHAVLKGAAVEMIGARAIDVGADLIVMTSHGRSGLSRTWLGSVADGVIRRSAVPVLVLRPVKSKASRIAAHHLFKRILVPIDGSERSIEILDDAIALAKCSDAHLTLLRVVQPLPAMLLDVGLPVMYPPTIQDPTATESLAHIARDEMAELGKTVLERGVAAVDVHVVIGDSVAQTILDFARGNGVDAVAMTTHGRGASKFFMGSVADKVLRASGLPVLLHKPVEVAAGVAAPQPHLTGVVI